MSTSVAIPEPIRRSLRKLTTQEGAELLAWLRQSLDAAEAEGHAQAMRELATNARQHAESRGLKAMVG